MTNRHSQDKFDSPLFPLTFTPLFFLLLEYVRCFVDFCVSARVVYLLFEIQKTKEQAIRQNTTGFDFSQNTGLGNGCTTQHKAAVTFLSMKKERKILQRAAADYSTYVAVRQAAIFEALALTKIA
jgi:hypothetical protein